MARKELVIRIELPSGRRARAVLVALLMLGGAGAFAGLYTPGAYKAGDKLSAATLNQDFANLKKAIDELDARTNVLADCPNGYSRMGTVTAPVCARGVDEIVKVGSGKSAFFIDRYEASVWSDREGAGMQYGAMPSAAGPPPVDYPVAFARNGQRGATFVELYAVSKSGVLPSVWLTWFQAQQACRASGKRLPTDEEWLAAASGTSDPGNNLGTNGACLTGGAVASGPRTTGQGAACVSAWGAQDMIGNVFEWTASWYAGIGSEKVVAWNDPAYGGDAINNITNGSLSHSAADVTGFQDGHPAAALRGGAWFDGTGAGVFALSLRYTPTAFSANSGFRCVTP